MMIQKILKTAGFIIVALVTGAMVVSCTSSGTTTTTTSTTTTTTTETTPSPGGPGGAVINSDSIISGEIKAIRAPSTGYPWEVDVLVQTSQDVNNLPNPTSDKIGQTVTMKTDEDMAGFQAGQQITARAKYAGDVPLPGITLYLYDIKAK